MILTCCPHLSDNTLASHVQVLCSSLTFKVTKLLRLSLADLFQWPVPRAAAEEYEKGSSRCAEEPHSGILPCLL